MLLPKHSLAVDPLSLDFSGGKPFYVYLYRDPRPGKKQVPIYVGKGTVSRMRAENHWREVRWRPGLRNPLLDAVLQKILARELEAIIEVVGYFEREGDAFRTEKALIARFGRRNLNRGPLCNLTDGGEGGAGLVPSPEALAKISDALRGRVFSPEHRANLSAASLGKPLSDKRKAAITESLKLAQEARRGSKCSVETRANMSAAMRGKPASDKKKAAIKVLADARRGKPASPGTIAANLGKTQSPESNAKRSETLRGRVFSPEHLAKIAATKQARAAERKRNNLAD